MLRFREYGLKRFEIAGENKNCWFSGFAIFLFLSAFFFRRDSYITELAHRVIPLESLKMMTICNHLTSEWYFCGLVGSNSG